MTTCPVCDYQPQVWARLPESLLLAHVWKHLRMTDNKPSCRACWCGRNFFGYVFWLKHMAGLDVQAHYIAHALGVGQ